MIYIAKDKQLDYTFPAHLNKEEEDPKLKKLHLGSAKGELDCDDSVQAV